MKKLLLVIVLITSLFGDTIRYKASLFIKTTKENVKFLGISDKMVYFKYSNDIVDLVSCKTVNEILDSDGNEITFDCKSNDFIPPMQPSFFSKQKHKIGGAIIALGGAILYNMVDKRCSESETYEHCTDRINTQSKIGYGLIIVGGLIIALGE